MQHFAQGKLAVGSFGELRKHITVADVEAYAGLLGDDNPVHLDAAYAAGTRFGRPIAHGMLAAGLIPTIFGAQIPGALYVSQSLRFKRPVYVGDEVVARVTVKAVRGGGGGGGAAPSAADAGGSAIARPSPSAAAASATGRGLYVTCDTVVRTAADGHAVIEGEAVVLLPPQEQPPGNGAGGSVRRR